MAAASMFDPPVVLGHRGAAADASATPNMSRKLRLWDDAAGDAGGLFAVWWASLAAGVERTSRSRGAWLLAALIVSLGMWVGIVKATLLLV